MKYDKAYFDYNLDRRNTWSSKWDGCNEKFGVDPKNYSQLGAVHCLCHWLLSFPEDRPVVMARPGWSRMGTTGNNCEIL